MNVVSSSAGVLTHGAHRAISYVWTLGGASRRTFFFADVGAMKSKTYIARCIKLLVCGITIL